jgi:hypothetical protein
VRLRRSARVPIEAVPTAHDAPQSLVASAARIKLDGLGWRTYRFGDDTWQTEAWRLYDIVGELRFVANWIGSACSRVRIYVAQVDDNGRVQKEVTKAKVAGLADTLFGGPSSKAEALRMLGINLTVAGDCFIIGRGTDDPESDEWHIVSTSELKRWGNRVTWEFPDGEKEQLNPNMDLIIRVWTPHPRRNLWADSPTKAALPMLWEIERLTRYVFAQIDSRLVSAGLMFIPKEVSFPDEVDDDGNLLTGGEALTSRLLKTGSASLKGEGTAAGVVPTFAEAPLEALGKMELIQFTSELSKQALDLRNEAIRRFALAMDIEPSILSGAGEANHWGAWQIMEGQINVHIVPLMTRICDALTTAYLQPALKSIKEDPDRFVFWYDTAPLTVRPERLKDTMEMYKEGHVRRETVLLSGDYKLSDLPEAEEDLLRFTRELMLRDPNLFQIPAVRKVAGYTDEILPPGTVVTPPAQPGAPGAGPPPPPAPPTGISPTPGGPMPIGESEAQNALGGPPPVPSGAPAGITAAASVPAAVNTFVISNATVLRALDRAGKKLLDRHSRDKWLDVPAYELHTRIRVGDASHATKLLDGAWDHLPVLVEAVDHSVDTEALKASLQEYCVTLLTNEQPHQVNLLGQHLRDQGFLDGSA